MNPYKFTIEGNKTIFHYKKKELKEWYKRGLEFGDCGFILVEREGKILKYQGFGTIEHPSKEEKFISLVHNELFDGKLSTDEEICNPKPKEFSGSYRLVMINFSK